MLKWLSLLCVVSCAANAADSTYNPLEAFAPLSLPTSANSIREGSGLPGPNFWQNRVDYKINATIHTDSKTLSGSEVIAYTNKSPDALSELWVQLDQNIYRRDSRAALSSDRKREHFTDGYQIKSVELLSKGKAVPLHYLITDTRMRVDLPKALAAKGGKLDLKISYAYQIPGTWGGRTAVTPSKNGDIYEIAQWFPRMAVYDDLRGWDTKPYLGQEFYLEYGDIDYKVTVPWNYLVVGSGKLMNPKDVLTKTERERLDKAQHSDKTVYIRKPDEVTDPASRPTHSGTKTWHFHMQHTRDVAFAASPAFIIDAARINLPGGKHSLAMSAYPVEGVGKTKWNRSTEYVKGAIEHFSKKWYPYPWPVAVNLGGHGAGMEYPGIVFDGMHDKNPVLFWITAHEIGHTWFPMVVGSNERRHAFMDEGFNTFIDVYASDAFNHGEFGPKRDPEYAPGGGNPVDEIVPILADPDAPTIMAPADSISEKYRHSISYFKPALGLILLREQILGPKRFDKAFRKYIRTWAYKHPTPSDFFRFMESEGGEDLSWWWRGWYFNNWQLDFAVDKAEYADKADPAKGLKVTFSALKKLVMPATVRVDYKDGSHQDIRLPVETWRFSATPSILLPTSKAVAKVTIDPDHKLPDANRANNSLTL
ncbi:M1 family metallopeptidase [Gallaecimonas mangrovi]|uniref:M1 family metallopeptidase n=1 Tax=Gallaecimonas mangrovi TaxID=2291597 RepID=UPI000E202D40|nr:M1 family metallopeptidase [Gallaecimonas mangrovi]